MTDPLYELLVPYLSSSQSNGLPVSPSDSTTSKYLSRLTTLPLDALTSDEPTTLSQSTHSNLLALQSLSARSTTALVASSTHLTSLRSSLPLLASSATSLRHEIPSLDARAVKFSDRFSRTREENEVLDRRKRALLLERNIDRLSDILDLPTLLESAIASSSSSNAQNLSSSAATSSTDVPTSTSSASSSSYASALDLHSHIKRLHLLYPDSPLVSSIAAQTETAMREMTAQLIQSLRSQNIKLAAGMRTIGWLKRVAPDLDGSPASATSSSISSNAISSMAGGRSSSNNYNSRGSSSNSEGSLGALFLVCRLGTLMTMLSALAPLQDLADQETELRLQRRRRKAAEPAPADDKTSKGGGGGALWASGQQTERYLKRFIEIFREQSFAIVSMYRSIFPSGGATASSSTAGQGTPAEQGKMMSMNGVRSQNSLATSANANGRDSDGTRRHHHTPKQDTDDHDDDDEDPLAPIPSALATFPIHLITDLLMETLRTYLPNVQDQSSRESLLTQVLYCAGSLGRLGGDFGLMLADLGGSSMHGDGDGDGSEEVGRRQQETGKGERREEEEEDEDAEWVSVMKKHRVLAGKLEKMASGAGN